MSEGTKSQPRFQVVALNITVLIAVIAFCVAVKATPTDFAFLLLAWYAMVGWVKIACGVFPTFDNMPFRVLFMLGYIGSVAVSTWCALDRLVMGNLPTVGVVFIFAYTAVPELAKQSYNPESEIYKG